LESSLQHPTLGRNAIGGKRTLEMVSCQHIHRPSAFQPIPPQTHAATKIQTMDTGAVTNQRSHSIAAQGRSDGNAKRMNQRCNT
jgi:hypothetical protein